MRVALMALAALTLGCEPRWPWAARPDDEWLLGMYRELLAEYRTLTPENAEELMGVFGGAIGWRRWDVSLVNGPSLGRYHNLGNASMVAGRLPEAILAYRQGLKLAPNDDALRDNLAYARAQVAYPFGNHGRPEVDHWPPWLYRPSAFQAMAVTVLLYALASILVTRWFMTRRRATLVRAGFVFVLTLACGLFWGHQESESAWQDAHRLVVVAHDRTPLRKGNGPSYPAHAELPVLSRGMEARRLHERGDWLQIQFASGEVGWVEKSSVLVDEP